MNEREELFSYISDAFKGVHGFRPRHINWREETVESLTAIADSLHREIAEENEQEEAAIALTIQHGAADRATAIRWLQQADRRW